MRYRFSLWILLAGLFAAASAQDAPLPHFSAVDISAIGIPPVPMDRWGCTAADIDRNGWPDINNQKWRGGVTSQVYLNHNGVFTEISASSPQVMEAEKNGNALRSPIYIDFDNDGDRDLMFGTDYRLFLFRNDNNVFTDITAAMGITSSVPGFVSIYGYEMSAWTDYDNDGDLDAVVNQTSNKSYIFYRNDGTKFTNIANQVGLTNLLPLDHIGDQGFTTGRLQWVDYDMDGDADISAGFFLFRNDDGHFTEVAKSVGLAPKYVDLQFTDWFDYDLDGDLDYMPEGDGVHIELFKNEGGAFVDATQEVGLDLFLQDNQCAINVGDLDNDGDEDVFVQIDDWLGTDLEALLLNDVDETGQRYFVDIGSYVGFTKIGDRKGSVLIDYNMDGKLDIFISSAEYGAILYRNLGTEPANNWIGFDLWGSKSNKDAFGSWVWLYAGGKKYTRYTKSATTWKIQQHHYVHFGIGQTTGIDSLVIRWPRGDVEVFKNLAINKYHKITELAGTGVQTQPVQTPEQFHLAQNYPNPFNPETRIEYTLPATSEVLLEVFNMTGQKVATLVNENQAAGLHAIQWRGADEMEHILPSGLYLYKLSTPQASLTKKMLFVR
ncbi:T9SS type A sorting domain-containing protein [bacterium]|nr:T9SS type A sorting domain-containing protein [bacterium]